MRYNINFDEGSHEITFHCRRGMGEQTANVYFINQFMVCTYCPLLLVQNGGCHDIQLDPRHRVDRTSAMMCVLQCMKISKKYISHKDVSLNVD